MVGYSNEEFIGSYDDKICIQKYLNESRNAIPIRFKDFLTLESLLNTEMYIEKELFMR